ncbi:MAG: hypothetical protein HQ562_05935 [Candidatus Marinimicrobia bacterium]|nr:hypothetical protein [Candidatus Neomarinimicrobiota bacterium]
MSNRSRTIWHLLIFLTILSLIITAVVAYPVQRDWRKAQIRAQEERFGTDQDLEDVIEFLEQRLDQRNRYQFTLEAEPMHLTNVIYLYGGGGMAYRMRNKDKLRVTAIIDGKQQQALIQYDKQNYRVVVGDSVGGGEVVWIDADEVVIVKGDTEIHYQLSGLYIPSESLREKN